MDRLHIRLSTIGMVVLIAAAAALFAWRAGTQGAPPPALPARGAALFGTYCGACHSTADLAPRVRAGDPVRRAELERFLESHGDASAQEDREILDYLAAAGR